MCYKRCGEGDFEHAKRPEGPDGAGKREDAKGHRDHREDEEQMKKQRQKSLEKKI